VLVTSVTKMPPWYDARGRGAADGSLGRAARVWPWYGAGAVPARGATRASRHRGARAAWERCVWTWRRAALGCAAV
jgi:hypothetical protein